MSFVFCESLYATAHSLWHLRHRPALVGFALGGGSSTPSLCGKLRPGLGWDLAHELNSYNLKAKTCPECLAAYRKEREGKP